MNEQEFKEAFSDKKFVNELLRLKTGEQVRKALKMKGIILTTEELDKFAEVLVNALESNKITDEEIGNCSGGVSSVNALGSDNDKTYGNAVLGAKILASVSSLDVIPKDSFFKSNN